MITLRVEVMRSAGMIEEEIEEPKGWEGMTNAERDQWCAGAVEDMRNNIVATSYGYPGDEEEDQ